MPSPSNDLLNNLNPEQLAAVTWPPQSALILAGAGSGKTRVLTTRIAWLLQTQQASIHSILAVTFTNKAAKEMSLRIASMWPISTRAMWLGTFHGLCHRFLRLHFREAGLPHSFQIIDMSDQLSIIKRLLKQLNISDEVIQPRSLQGFINAQKEAGLRAGQLSAPDAYTQQLIQCFADYDSLCKREAVVDFAELMLKSYEILLTNEALRVHYQNRFNHILVDEFQDTNKLQYAWLKLIAGEHSAIFAVGDDDQSIYRFRGAHVGNMQRLMSDFKIKEPIKLEQNYRSEGNILMAANAVIKNNQGRLGKNLHTKQEAGEKIRLLWANSDFEEAQFVVEEAKALNQEEMAYDDMAVLYRSNAQSRILEQALFRAGVPYKIYGGLRFYERQEIKHALAYLRLSVNPDDDNALLRVINMPTRGIGTRTIESIQQEAQLAGISLWQAVCSMCAKSSKIASFVALIDKLKSYIGVMSLDGIMRAVIEETGLVDYYHQQKGDHQERIDNLEELVTAAFAFNALESNFEVLPEGSELQASFPVLAFLSNAVLESGEHQASADETALQLMTIHAAKGLEFNVVFLTGMEEGLFPSEYSLNEKDGLEEERRLMYVAITRARKRLYISASQQRVLHGRMTFGILSRFVEEVPKELLLSLSNSLKNSMNFEIPARVPSKNDIICDSDGKSFAGFKIGEMVRHPKFGTGVIIGATDKGQSARLIINFGQDGIKELDTQYAPLEQLN